MAIEKSGSPQWLWSRRPGGVKYRFILLNPAEKLWEIEVMSIANNALKIKYDVPGDAVNDPTPYLHQALFDFTKMNDERANAERARRKAQRDAQFEGAVQAGGEWEPDGRKEVDGNQEASEGAGSGGDRSLGAPTDTYDSEASPKRVSRKSKATPRKTSPRNKGRGQQAKSQA